MLLHVLGLVVAIGLVLYPSQFAEAAPGQQQFTTAGNHTFDVPAFERRLIVEVWGAGGGGGGGGAAFSTSGGTGGQSCFNGASAGVCTGGVIGNGGLGGVRGGGTGSGSSGGTASGGDVNTTGESGVSRSGDNGGRGGNSAQRGGTGNTAGGTGGVGAGGGPGGGGSGGACGSGFSGDGGAGGGGGGGYSRMTYAPGSITGTIHLVVGSQGSAGATDVCASGGAGALGQVRVSWDSVLVNSASSVTGSLHTIGSISKGSGSFVIDHPLDPQKKLLYHSFVESSELKNLYDGTAILDEDGEVTIILPDYFMALNRDFRYLATGMSEPMPDLHLQRGVRREWFFGAPSFRISGGKPGGTISWQVTGVRQDAYALSRPMQVEVEKGPDAIFGKNTCIFEPLCR